MNGGVTMVPNENYYLMNYLVKAYYYVFWTLTLSMFYSLGGYDRTLYVHYDGFLNHNLINDYQHFTFRSVINLVKDITIEAGGIGTLSNPYVISMY